MQNLPQYSNMLWNIDPANRSAGEGGPGGPGVAGSTTSGIGVPGVGPTDGTTTGGGNLTGGQAATAFSNGFVSGLPGVSFVSNLSNMAQNPQDIDLSSLGQLGLQGVGLASSLMGASPTSMVGKALFSGLINLAGKAQASTGVRLPSFEESLKEFTQNLKDLTLRSFFFGKEPNIKGPVPDVPGLPTNPDDPTEPSIPDGIATPGQISVDPNDPSETGGGPASGEGGNVGEGSGGSGPGGTAAWYHGGLVDIGSYGRDKVPGHLTRGEYVIDADSTRKYKPLLDLINHWEPR